MPPDATTHDNHYVPIWYPRGMWHLCRTVFSVAVERAVKYARNLGRPLRVYVEGSTKDDERRIKEYYKALITAGLPFDAERSKSYEPLSAAELNETLIELRFKGKSSPPMQIADLCLWPLAMVRYGRSLLPYERLREAGKLIEAQLAPEHIPLRGTKYSCFELVDQAPRNNKGPVVTPSL